MLGGEGAERVPGDLRVVVAMIVDKAGRDGMAGRIDRPGSGAGQFADLGELAVLDRDIAAERRHPRAVDNEAVLDQQVIRHRCPSSRGSPGWRPPLTATVACADSARRAFAAWVS